MRTANSVEHFLHLGTADSFVFFYSTFPICLSSRFTQRNMLRVYPKGIRFDSSNYNPLVGWTHGAQMVAFNMQVSTSQFKGSEGTEILFRILYCITKIVIKLTILELWKIYSISDADMQLHRIMLQPFPFFIFPWKFTREHVSTGLWQITLDDAWHVQGQWWLWIREKA